MASAEKSGALPSPPTDEEKDIRAIAEHYAKRGWVFAGGFIEALERSTKQKYTHLTAEIPNRKADHATHLVMIYNEEDPKGNMGPYWGFRAPAGMMILVTESAFKTMAEPMQQQVDAVLRAARLGLKTHPELNGTIAVEVDMARHLATGIIPR